MTTAPRTPATRGGARPVVALTATAVLLAACSGGGDGGSDQPPEEALAGAKRALDETSGVTLSLSAPDLPDDVDGILRAKGVATHAPAFDGDLTLVVNGLDVEVPVVSVDGVVYARLPFTSSFSEVNPADYGAPDPAGLMDPDTGLSTWLTEATGVEQGDPVRDGRTVLSTYTGSLPGAVVDASIPSADAGGAFPTTFHLDQDGRLRSVEVSGPFYGATGTVDYTVDVGDYGTDQVVEKP
ncbi:LppX_LprAFG lipoprotein [Nocardioides rubriscoriae]|uniref:LppX_LprAFG lipoprotein n=1 Tax=Nocardioides rubriscoriae TaxID=642762 RepID=UPI0014790E4F|nr:LppX_LprAFG lipoprotein [Nocardioides rubriscoriae]